MKRYFQNRKEDICSGLNGGAPKTYIRLTWEYDLI